MTIGRKIELVLFLLIVGYLVAFAGGCVDAATKALIADGNNKAAAEIASIKNQAKVDAEKAKENTAKAIAVAATQPTAHPIMFANEWIAEVRGPVILVGSISTLAFFVGIGLIVASLFASVLGTVFKSVGLVMAPLAGCVAGGCWGVLVFLPIAPWIIAGCASLALVLFLVQLAHAKWSIADLFGLHVANSKAIVAVAQGKPPTKMDVPVPPVVAPKAVITDIQSATASQDAPIVAP